VVIHRMIVEATYEGIPGRSLNLDLRIVRRNVGLTERGGPAGIRTPDQGIMSPLL
jgi:hypothetical protein